MLGEAIANAIAGITGVAKPFIDASLSQRFSGEHHDRIDEWMRVLHNLENAKNDAEKFTARGELHSFVLRLLKQAERPTNGMGLCYLVPVDVLTGLIAETSESIMEQQKLNWSAYKQP